MLVTVTLNPALDALVFLEHLNWHSKNILDEKNTFASGKGYNVAKALASLGRPVTALGFVGIADLPFYEQTLRSRGIALVAVPIDATRTNLKLIERDTGLETEINERGVEVDDVQRSALLEAFRVQLPAADWIILSGSIAPGLDKTIYRDLIEQAAAAGVKTMLDASGGALLAGASVHPTLLRINRLELGEITGRDLASLEEIAAAGRSLVHEGTQFVVASLGKLGALLASRDGVWHASPPAVKVVNAIGAGDVMGAGIVEGLERGLESPELIRWATALATASVLTLESGEVDSATARELEQRVTVRQIQ